MYFLFHRLSFFGLLAISAALVDHDGWEFYGGRKKRRAHGLNRVTKDTAPVSHGGVAFDEETKIKLDFIVTSDEAPEAPKIQANSKLRNVGSRIKSKEELLLLPDRFGVLNFDPGFSNVDSSWWGRLYVEGFASSMQYFRAHFGLPPPAGTIKLLLASPLSMCDDMTGLPILKNAAEVDGTTVVVAMRGECTFGEKAIAAYNTSDAVGVLFVNNAVSAYE